MKLRRGVASYVNACGGKLYLWAKPFGGFDWVRASTEPPEGVEFVPSRAVTDFELFVDRSMRQYPQVKLARRWWGLRAGVVVNTGFWLGPEGPG